MSDIMDVKMMSEKINTNSPVLGLDNEVVDEHQMSSDKACAVPVATDKVVATVACKEQLGNEQLTLELQQIRTILDAMVYEPTLQYGSIHASQVLLRRLVSMKERMWRKLSKKDDELRRHNAKILTRSNELRHTVFSQIIQFIKREQNILREIIECRHLQAVNIRCCLYDVIDLVVIPPHTDIYTPNYTVIAARINQKRNELVFDVSTAKAVRIFTSKLTLDNLHTLITSLQHVNDIMQQSIRERRHDLSKEEYVRNLILEQQTCDIKDAIEPQHYETMGELVNCYNVNLTLTDSRIEQLKNFAKQLKTTSLLILHQYIKSMIETTTNIEREYKQLAT